ncbi:uncharacterized protein [Temnothorax longispinosus]|uniref:Uncharacterized protein n=1 Tax=Temnothorax longispinosus TaxID=300112 RepID=A0A4S2JDL7_9HYME|nr:hypothetical protein DBV15_10107 [Temnothorax longispinosus]
MDSIIDQINQQLVVSNFIAKAYDNFVRKGSSGITKQRTDIYLSSLEENWNRFSLTHDAILMEVARLTSEDRQLIRTHSYFTDRVLTTHRNYLAAVEQITARLSAEQQNVTGSFSTSSRSQDILVPNVSQHQHARLPQVNIPTFDGTPSEWLNFRDSFTSLVLSNASLTSIEKLQYLKTSLIGYAAHLIKNTTLTSDNLLKAWNLLLSFYDKPRIQVNTSSAKNPCPVCKRSHYIVKCPKYIDATTNQKLTLIAKYQLCYNCLAKHRVVNCKVTKRCRTCGKKHHTTIHKERTSSNTKDVKSEPQLKSSPAVAEAEKDTP